MPTRKPRTGASQTSPESQPEYDVAVREDVMVPMRDGVRLATDIYFPAREGKRLPGPFPVVLQRTPYGKTDPDRVERHCRHFARSRYVAILQDCRGCFNSEGEHSFLAQEAQDGYDTVEWLVRQPWCNGKIGIFGTSYMSWTQSALATQNPPGLACMMPNMGGWNAHTSSVRQGGAMELRWLAWAFWHSGTNPNRSLKSEPWTDAALAKADFRDWLCRLPLRPGHSPLALVPPYERWALAIYSTGEYTSFWKQPGYAIEEYLRQHADVPIYLSGGWYDSYTRSTLEAFVALSTAKKGPVKVLIGPWTHGEKTMQVSYAGDTDLGPQAALPSLEAFRLRWFDRWLRGLPNGAEQDPPVKLFVMGGGTGRKTAEGRLDHGGSWREEAEWPLARTRSTSHYLHGDGTLSPEAPPIRRSSTTFTFDPAEPVPTIGGNLSSLDYLKPLPPNVDPRTVPPTLRREPITPNGGWDQRERPGLFGCKPPYLPLAARPDVLVFQTPPLQRDVEVTGPTAVKLWVSSSAPDTDFTAKLIDVYPPNQDYPEGYALNLADSIVRARYRNDREKGELLNPGEVYPLTITLYPTSNLFKKGHRIRLDISSSNFPRFDINPNTGEPIGQHRRSQVAENTVHHDAEHPSHIVLPIIPSG
ncbi:MAG: CocE/NonD family hydrolase [Chloroflexi bacterium]|nr:CocE/NonD family hydrolase [Chloroflexota bacterium]